MKKFMLSPSILDADFSRLDSAIKLLDTAKVDFIHLDIMDGHFVPNISFGPKIIKPLRALTKIPFDTHLMISAPEKYLDGFIDAGSDYITVHYEASKDMLGLMKSIKARGVKFGISIKPGTPVETLYDLLPELDLVLIMSVEPGFGGQKFMIAMLEKVKKLRALKDKNNYSYIIEIDGGINKETLPSAIEAGADAVVVGSAIFGAKDPAAEIEALRACVK